MAKAALLKPGQRVKITHYQGTEQTTAWNFVVVAYDDGLLTVRKDMPGTKGKPEIFNLRSLGVVRVEQME